MSNRAEDPEHADAPASQGSEASGGFALEVIVRRVLVVTLVAVVLYGAMVLYRGLGQVLEQFRAFSWWTFAAACGLAFGNYLLRFLKWEYYLGVLGIRGVPKGESFLTFLSGFVLTVSPGKVGEVFKSLVLYKTRGVALARSAPIIVAERLTDLIGVIAMIALGSLGFDGGLVWALAGSVVVVAILLFIAVPALSAPLLRLVRKIPRIGERVVPPIEEMLLHTRSLTTPLRLVWPTLLSVVGWSLEGVGLCLILQGFGQTTALPLAAFFYATATLAGALIPLPGGLGVTDKLLEEQLVHLGGVATGAATAAMLLIRFATLWFAVGVGFVALGALRVSNPNLRLTPDAKTGSCN